MATISIPEEKQGGNTLQCHEFFCWISGHCNNLETIEYVGKLIKRIQIKYSKYKMKEGDGKVTDIKHDDEVEKDLGVLFDTKLSFRQHIGCTVKKVNRMIGLTRRTFHYMDQEVFRLLFTSLMRPHMDYADCI